MRAEIKALIEELKEKHTIGDAELMRLVFDTDDTEAEALYAAGREVCEKAYGNKVFLRGLIAFTSICKNDCFYCGLRRSNTLAERYRLTEEDILERCRFGYESGFRTFVLQGGEDGHFTDDILCDTVRAIKRECPEAAVTLSVGERSYESYKALREAGADRYLLRHETASPEHYSKLHPESLTLEKRVKCLGDLKSLGYQVGCGFMVGSPYQSKENIIADLRFIEDFRPQMVGIGPFLPHKDTPFGDHPPGSVEITLRLLSVIRLMNPNVLLPATTALGTASGDGRERGMKAGANVVMPNLSPPDVRKKYMLYDGKLSSGAEAAEEIALLREKMERIGKCVSMERGDAGGIGNSEIGIRN